MEYTGRCAHDCTTYGYLAAVLLAEQEEHRLDLTAGVNPTNIDRLSVSDGGLG